MSRLELLAQYSIVEDVLLRVECTEINVYGENTDYDEYVVWHYNPDGTLNHLRGGVQRLPEYRYLRYFFTTDVKY